MLSRAPTRSIAPPVAPNCPMTRLASGRGATMPPGLRMALRSGARLGPYEIVSAIGAGRSAAWRMPWTPGRPPRRARQRRRQSRHPHAVRSPRKAPIGGHAYARLFQGLAGDAGMSLHPGRPPTAATDRNRCEQPAPKRFCQAKERCNIASRFGLSYLSAALCLCAVEAITIMTKPKTDLLAWQSADGASRLFCGGQLRDSADAAGRERGLRMD